MPEQLSTSTAIVQADDCRASISSLAGVARCAHTFITPSIEKQNKDGVGSTFININNLSVLVAGSLLVVFVVILLALLAAAICEKQRHVVRGHSAKQISLRVCRRQKRSERSFTIFLWSSKHLPALFMLLIVVPRNLLVAAVSCRITDGSVANGLDCTCKDVECTARDTGLICSISKGGGSCSSSSSSDGGGSSSGDGGSSSGDGEESSGGGGSSNFDPLPDSTGSEVRSEGLRKVVDNWIQGGTTKVSAIAQYGEIENWDMSQVTNMANLFKSKETFNSDLSKWNTSKVENMWKSAYMLRDIYNFFKTTFLNPSTFENSG